METAVITGASRGIGLELTRQFLELGYRVIATYRDQPSAQLSELLTHKTLTLLELEVTNSDSITKFSGNLTDTPIDILINNAGVLGLGDESLEGITPEDWATTFAVNTIAPLMVSRALLPQIKSSAKPRIITISSQMGSLNLHGTGMYAYRSSKAAVNKSMQILALELKEQGVIVCPVHPGWVQTDMGGATADITVQESAAGIINLIRQLGIEQTGKFFTWEGKEHAW